MRKVLENRSASDEERMKSLEAQLKEATALAEENDRKCDEVKKHFYCFPHYFVLHGFLFYIFFACICMYACLKIIRYFMMIISTNHDPCTLKTNSKPLTCHQSLTYDQLVLTINLLFYARIVCILLTYCCTCALHFET